MHSVKNLKLSESHPIKENTWYRNHNIEINNKREIDFRGEDVLGSLAHYHEIGKVIYQN